ncbi:hypothetical protein [Chitinophaga sp. HK235]|uniref:hypothetical protein n=1 Tax=Chitinophaga sp. HK235 TaxID=2952571 RepID=UPI001BAC0AFF|nr:hypothetical protein [Chitinophaga sp. HK235]
MNNNQLKDQLKAALVKKELVKPNLTESRLSMEVESLCDGFCNGSTNLGRGQGSAPIQDSDILF